MPRCSTTLGILLSNVKIWRVVGMIVLFLTLLGGLACVRDDGYTSGYLCNNPSAWDWRRAQRIGDAKLPGLCIIAACTLAQCASPSVEW